METNLSKDKDKISSMFDSIAGKYDFLNHALSLNIDKSWRKKLIKTVRSQEAKMVLDLACGTGDVSFGLAEADIKIIGGDISREMLKIAEQKKEKCKHKENIQFEYCEADNLRFENDTFDAITISFGIRNFDQRQKCIKELYRVLKPGGLLAILEFTIPKNSIWKGIYSFYFRNILPSIGKLVSGQKAAYVYLPESAFSFPQREEFCKELSTACFKTPSYESLTGGVACLYKAIK